MINPTDLHQVLVTAGIPIAGVASSGRVDFAPEATPEQMATAQTIVANYDQAAIDAARDQAAADQAAKLEAAQDAVKDLPELDASKITDPTVQDLAKRVAYLEQVVTKLVGGL